MFLFRSMFWLTAVVLVLPPVDGERPARRPGFLEIVQAGGALVQDVSGLCERNRDACATGRDALALVQRKIETGTVSAGMAQRTKAGAASLPASLHGTLTAADLEPEWVGPAPPDG